ncbi:MAG: hypothetical protein PHO37_15795 [Kiritimatiellae bacterium]|nr:hypothetical protein [Kiritimatiellia bacterium]
MSLIAPVFFFLCLSVLLSGCSPTTQVQSQQLPSSSRSVATSSSAIAEISEDQAVTLLRAALKAHQVADLECLGFVLESDLPAGSKAAAWEFAAREIHNAKCGGDPSTSPVRDRYKVQSNGEVSVYDFLNDEYKAMRAVGNAPGE